MKIIKQPTSVSITFSPKDYYLKKTDDDINDDYMLVHRIDMSYADKCDQEGASVLYLTNEEAQILRDAGFDEIL